MHGHRHEYLDLQQRLQIASELARVQQVIDVLRGGRELEDTNRECLLQYLHPWLVVIGKQRAVMPSLAIDLNPFWEILQKPGYLDTNKERLTLLCEELEMIELSGPSKEYALELARQFRHELLY